MVITEPPVHFTAATEFTDAVVPPAPQMLDDDQSSLFTTDRSAFDGSIEGLFSQK